MAMGDHQPMSLGEWMGDELDWGERPHLLGCLVHLREMTYPNGRANLVPKGYPPRGYIGTYPSGWLLLLTDSPCCFV